VSRVGSLQMRLRCDPPPDAALERTHQRVWLTSTCCADRYGVRGVAASRLDLLLDQRLRDGTDPDPRDLVILEIRAHPGRYSGEVRDRLAWRVHRPSDVGADGRRADDLAWAQIDVEEVPGVATVTLTEGSGGVVWQREYPVSRWECDDRSPARLITWTWHRYYGHLCWIDVEPLAACYTIAPGATVSEAVREAGRQLYRLSRELGWRKMTLRERRRLWGPDGDSRPLWHRESELLSLHASREAGISATGCGEATLRAAGGGPLAPREVLR